MNTAEFAGAVICAAIIVAGVLHELGALFP